MPQFSPSSLTKLEACHPDLQRLFNEVIKYYNIQIIYGFRSVKEQQELFAKGRTLENGVWRITNKAQIVTYCDGVKNVSKHNHAPAMAVDVAPYPVDWDDELSFAILGGKVLEIARQLGIRMKYGADWNGDGKTQDERLIDLPHFELL